MGNIFNLVGRIDIDNSNAQKSMAETQGQAENTAKTVSKSFGGRFTNNIANGFTNMFGRISRTFQSLQNLLGAFYIPRAIGAIASTFSEAQASVVSFERQFREVTTLLSDIPHDDQYFKDLQRDIKDLQLEFGITADKAIPALYAAISASVPPDNVIQFLSDAQKAATAGVTDLETAVDGLTSVVNAYGDDVISSARASDILFAAVQGGKTTFGELANSLSVVTGEAVASNIPFEQVGAALATITSVGNTTNVSATQLRSVIKELSEDGSKAGLAFQNMQHEMVPVGQTFAEFIADGGTLAEALQYLNESAEANGENFRGMFSRVEAANAAFVLGSSSVDKFASELDRANNSAGSTEAAFEKMASTTQASMNKVKAFYQVLLLDLGEAILPIINKRLERFLANSEKNRDRMLFLIHGLAQGVNGAIDLFDDLISAFQGLDSSIKNVNSFVLILYPFINLMKELAAITLAPLINQMAIISQGFFGEIAKSVAVLENALRSLSLSELTIQNISNLLFDFAYSTLTAFNNAIGQIDFISIGQSVVEGFAVGLTKSGKLLLDSIKNILSNFINYTKETLGINSPSEVFEDIGKNLILGLIQGVKGMFSNISTLAKNIAKDLTNSFNYALDEAFSSLTLNIVSVILAPFFDSASSTQAISIFSKDFIKNFNKFFLNYFKNTVSGQIIENITRPFKDLGSLLDLILQRQLTFIYNKLASSKLGNAILESFHGLKELALDYINNALSPIVNLLDNIFDNLIKNTLSEYLSGQGIDIDFGDVFSAAGGSAIQEFVDGMEGMNLAEKVKHVFQSAIDFLFAFFGTGPAYLFDLGITLIGGFLFGFMSIDKMLIGDMLVMTLFSIIETVMASFKAEMGSKFVQSIEAALGDKQASVLSVIFTYVGAIKQAFVTAFTKNFNQSYFKAITMIALDPLLNAMSIIRAAFQSIDIYKLFEEMIDPKKLAGLVLSFKALDATFDMVMSYLGKSIFKSVDKYITGIFALIFEKEFSNLPRILFELIPVVAFYNLGKAIFDGLQAGIDTKRFKLMFAGLRVVFGIFVKQLMNVAGDVKENASAIATNLTEGLKQGVAQQWPNLLSFFANQFYSVIDKVKEIFGINSPSTVMIKLGGYIVKGLKIGVIDNLVKLVTLIIRMGPDLKNAFINALDFTKLAVDPDDWSSKYVNDLLNPFIKNPKLFNTIGKFVKELSSTFVEQFKYYFDESTSGEILGQINKLLSPIFTVTKNLLSNFAKAFSSTEYTKPIVDSFNIIFKNLKIILFAFPTKFGQYLGRELNLALEIMLKEGLKGNKIVIGIKDFFQMLAESASVGYLGVFMDFNVFALPLYDLVQELPKLFKSIINFKAFANTMTDLGKNLGLGLITGFRQSVKGIQSVAEYIIVAVKNIFGIKSPSTVFMAIGGMIVAGFTKGMAGIFLVSKLFTGFMTTAQLSIIKTSTQVVASLAKDKQAVQKLYTDIFEYQMQYEALIRRVNEAKKAEQNYRNFNAGKATTTGLKDGGLSMAGVGTDLKSLQDYQIELELAINTDQIDSTLKQTASQLNTDLKKVIASTKKATAKANTEIIRDIMKLQPNVQELFRKKDIDAFLDPEKTRAIFEEYDNLSKATTDRAQKLNDFITDNTERAEQEIKESVVAVQKLLSQFTSMEKQVAFIDDQMRDIRKEYESKGQAFQESVAYNNLQAERKALMIEKQQVDLALGRAMTAREKTMRGELGVSKEINQARQDLRDLDARSIEENKRLLILRIMQGDSLKDMKQVLESQRASVEDNVDGELSRLAAAKLALETKRQEVEEQKIVVGFFEQQRKAQEKIAENANDIIISEQQKKTELFKQLEALQGVTQETGKYKNNLKSIVNVAGQAREDFLGAFQDWSQANNTINQAKGSYEKLVGTYNNILDMQDRYNALAALGANQTQEQEREQEQLGKSLQVTADEFRSIISTMDGFDHVDANVFNVALWKDKSKAITRVGQDTKNLFKDIADVDKQTGRLTLNFKDLDKSMQSWLDKNTNADYDRLTRSMKTANSQLSSLRTIYEGLPTDFEMFDSFSPEQLNQAKEALEDFGNSTRRVAEASLELEQSKIVFGENSKEVADAQNKLQAEKNRLLRVEESYVQNAVLSNEELYRIYKDKTALNKNGNAQEKAESTVLLANLKERKDVSSTLLKIFEKRLDVETSISAVNKEIKTAEKTRLQAQVQISNIQSKMIQENQTLLALERERSNLDFQYGELDAQLTNVKSQLELISDAEKSSADDRVKLQMQEMNLIKEKANLEKKVAESAKQTEQELNDIRRKAHIEAMKANQQMMDKEIQNYQKHFSKLVRTFTGLSIITGVALSIYKYYDEIAAALGRLGISAETVKTAVVLLSGALALVAAIKVTTVIMSMNESLAASLNLWRLNREALLTNIKQVGPFAQAQNNLVESIQRLNASFLTSAAAAKKGAKATLLFQSRLITTIAPILIIVGAVVAAALIFKNFESPVLRAVAALGSFLVIWQTLIVFMKVSAIAPLFGAIAPFAAIVAAVITLIAVIKPLRNALLGLVQILFNLVAPVFEFIGKVSRDGLDGLGSMIKQRAINLVKNLLAGFLSPFKKARKLILDAFLYPFKWAWAQVDKWWGVASPSKLAMSLGWNIILGITAPFLNAGKFIINAMLAPFKGAWNAFLTFFKIKSPSGLGKEAGANISTGVTQGVESGLGDFTRTVSQFGVPLDDMERRFGGFADTIGSFFGASFERLIERRQVLTQQLGEALDIYNSLIASGLDDTDKAVQESLAAVDKAAAGLANVEFKIGEQTNTDELEAQMDVLLSDIASFENAALNLRENGQEDLALIQDQAMIKAQDDLAKLQSQFENAQNRQVVVQAQALDERQQNALEYLNNAEIISDAEVRANERNQTEITRSLEREQQNRLDSYKRYLEDISAQSEIQEVRMNLGFTSPEEEIERLVALREDLMNKINEENQAGDAGNQALVELASQLDGVTSQIETLQTSMRELDELEATVSVNLDSQLKLDDIRKEIQDIYSQVGGESADVNSLLNPEQLERLNALTEQRLILEEEIANNAEGYAATEADRIDVQIKSARQELEGLSAVQEQRALTLSERRRELELRQEISDLNQAAWQEEVDRLSAQITWSENVNNVNLDGLKELHRQKASLLEQEVMRYAAGTTEQMEARANLTEFLVESANTVSEIQVERDAEQAERLSGQNRLYKSVAENIGDSIRGIATMLDANFAQQYEIVSGNAIKNIERATDATNDLTEAERLSALEQAKNQLGRAKALTLLDRRMETSLIDRQEREQSRDAQSITDEGLRQNRLTEIANEAETARAQIMADYSAQNAILQNEENNLQALIDDQRIKAQAEAAAKALERLDAQYEYEKLIGEKTVDEIWEHTKEKLDLQIEMHDEGTEEHFNALKARKEAEDQYLSDRLGQLRSEADAMKRLTDLQLELGMAINEEVLASYQERIAEEGRLLQEHTDGSVESELAILEWRKRSIDATLQAREGYYTKVSELNRNMGKEFGSTFSQALRDSVKFTERLGEELDGLQSRLQPSMGPIKTLFNLTERLTTYRSNKGLRDDIQAFENLSDIDWASISTGQLRQMIQQRNEEMAEFPNDILEKEIEILQEALDNLNFDSFVSTGTEAVRALAAATAQAFGEAARVQAGFQEIYEDEDEQALRNQRTNFLRRMFTGQEFTDAALEAQDRLFDLTMESSSARAEALELDFQLSENTRTMFTDLESDYTALWETIQSEDFTQEDILNLEATEANIEMLAQIARQAGGTVAEEFEAIFGQQLLMTENQINGVERVFSYLEQSTRTALERGEILWTNADGTGYYETRLDLLNQELEMYPRMSEEYNAVMKKIADLETENAQWRISMSEAELARAKAQGEDTRALAEDIMQQQIALTNEGTAERIKLEADYLEMRNGWIQEDLQKELNRIETTSKANEEYITHQQTLEDALYRERLARGQIVEMTEIEQIDRNAQREQDRINRALAALDEEEAAKIAAAEQTGENVQIIEEEFAARRNSLVLESAAVAATASADRAEAENAAAKEEEDRALAKLERELDAEQTAFDRKRELADLDRQLGSLSAEESLQEQIAYSQQEVGIISERHNAQVDMAERRRERLLANENLTAEQIEEINREANEAIAAADHEYQTGIRQNSIDTANLQKELADEILQKELETIQRLLDAWQSYYDHKTTMEDVMRERERIGREATTEERLEDLEIEDARIIESRNARTKAIRDQLAEELDSEAYTEEEKAQLRADAAAEIRNLYNETNLALEQNENERLEIQAAAEDERVSNAVEALDETTQAELKALDDRDAARRHDLALQEANGELSLQDRRENLQAEELLYRSRYSVVKNGLEQQRAAELDNANLTEEEIAEINERYDRLHLENQEELNTNLNQLAIDRANLDAEVVQQRIEGEDRAYERSLQIGTEDNDMRRQQLQERIEMTEEGTQARFEAEQAYADFEASLLEQQTRRREVANEMVLAQNTYFAERNLGVQAYLASNTQMIMDEETRASEEAIATRYMLRERGLENILDVENSGYIERRQLANKETEDEIAKIQERLANEEMSTDERIELESELSEAYRNAAETRRAINEAEINLARKLNRISNQDYLLMLQNRLAATELTVQEELALREEIIDLEREIIDEELQLIQDRLEYRRTLAGDSLDVNIKTQREELAALEVHYEAIAALEATTESERLQALQDIYGARMSLFEMETEKRMEDLNKVYEAEDNALNHSVTLQDTRMNHAKANGEATLTDELGFIQERQTLEENTFQRNLARLDEEYNARLAVIQSTVQDEATQARLIAELDEDVGSRRQELLQEREVQVIENGQAILEQERAIAEETRALTEASLDYEMSLAEGNFERQQEIRGRKLALLQEDLANAREGTAEEIAIRGQILDAEREMQDALVAEQEKAVDKRIELANREFDQRESNLSREKELYEQQRAAREAASAGGRADYDDQKREIAALEEFARREHEIAIQRMEDNEALAIQRAMLIQDEEERADELARIEYENTEARKDLNHQFNMEMAGLAEDRADVERTKLQEIVDFERAIYEERLSRGDVGEQEITTTFSADFGDAASYTEQFNVVKGFIENITGLYQENADERVAAIEAENNATTFNFEQRRSMLTAQLEMEQSVTQQRIEQAKFEQEINEMLYQDGLEDMQHAYDMRMAAREREIVLAERQGATEEELAAMRLEMLQEEAARAQEQYQFKLSELERTSAIEKEQLVADAEFAMKSEQEKTEMEIKQNRLSSEMQINMLETTTQVKIASLRQGLEVALATIDAELKARMAAGEITQAQYQQQNSALNAIRNDNQKTIVDLESSTGEQLRQMRTQMRNDEQIAREQLNLSIAQQEQQLANNLLQIDTNLQTEQNALDREFAQQEIANNQAIEDAKWESAQAAAQKRIEQMTEENERSQAARDKELEDYRYAQSEKEAIAQQEHDLAMARANSEQERATLARQFEENQFNERLARLDQESALQEQLLQQQIADINRLATAKANVEGADPVAIERERAQAVADLQQEITTSTREQTAERRAILNEQNIWRINSEHEVAQALIDERNKEFEDFKASLERKNQAYQESTDSVLSLLSQGSAQRLALQQESVEAEFSTRASILDEERAMLEERLQLETLSAEQRQEIQERLAENEREFLAANSERRMAHYEADKERRAALNEEEIEEMRERGASEVEIEKKITEQRVEEIEHYIAARKELGSLTQEQEEALMTEIEQVRVEGAERVADKEVEITKQKTEEQKNITQKAIDEETKAIQEAHEERSRASQEASDRRIVGLERQKEALDDAYGGEETVAKIQKQAQIEIQIEQEKTKEKIKQLKMQQDMEQKTIEMIISMKRAAGMITKEEEKSMRDDLATSQKETNKEIQSLERGLSDSILDIRRGMNRSISDLREKQREEEAAAREAAHKEWQDKEKERLSQVKENADWEAEQAYKDAQHRIAMYEKSAEKQKILLDERKRLIEKHYDDIRSLLDFQRAYEDEIADFALQEFEQDLERRRMFGQLSQQEEAQAVQDRYAFEAQQREIEKARLEEDRALEVQRAKATHEIAIELINLEAEVEANKNKMAMQAEERKTKAQISNLRNYVRMMVGLGLMEKEQGNESLRQAKEMEDELERNKELHNKEIELMNLNKNLQIRQANEELNSALVSSDREYATESVRIAKEESAAKFGFEKETFEQKKAHQEENAQREQEIREQVEKDYESQIEMNEAAQQKEDELVRKSQERQRAWIGEKESLSEQGYHNEINRMTNLYSQENDLINKTYENKKQKIDEWSEKQKQALTTDLANKRQAWDQEEAERQSRDDKEIEVREKMQDFAARKAAASTKEEKDEIHQEYIKWLEEMQKQAAIAKAKANQDPAALQRMADQIKDITGLDVGNPLEGAEQARARIEEQREQRKVDFENQLEQIRIEKENNIQNIAEQRRLALEDKIAEQQLSLREREEQDKQKLAGLLEDSQAQAAERQRQKDLQIHEQTMQAEEEAANMRENRINQMFEEKMKDIKLTNKPNQNAIKGPNGNSEKPIQIDRFTQDASAHMGDVNVTIQGAEGLSAEEVGQRVREGIKSEFDQLAENLRRRAAGGGHQPMRIGSLSSK